MTKLRLTILLATLVAAVPPLAADTGINTADSTIVLEEEAKVRKLDDPAPVIVGGILEDGMQGSCVLEATKGDGSPRKGVKGTIAASLIDVNTFFEIEVLEPQTAKTGKDGMVTFDYPVPQRANFAQQVALFAQVDLKGGKKAARVSFSCAMVDATP